MRPRLLIGGNPADLTDMLGGLVAAARRDLQKNGGASLYESGVRYQREAPGREDWYLPSQTRRRRKGDCEDLSLWRAAELQEAGEDAWPLVYRSGPRTLHVVVERGDGTIEDPSRELGMGKQRVSSASGNRTMGVSMSRRRGRHYAEISAGDLVVGAVGSDKAQALHSAAKALDHALDNPVVQLAMPPGAAQAVRVIRGTTAYIRRYGAAGVNRYVSSLPGKARATARRVLKKVLPW